MGARFDNGYFPRGRSMLRRVHGERAVGLLHGQRALLVGAADPLTYSATAVSSRSPEMPFRRLAHTAQVLETIYFGTRAEADRVLAQVRRLHERVRGELPADAGPVPAGTSYSAFDPPLMLWTLACIAESAQSIYEWLVRALSDSEREALWADYVRLGELFGLPRADAPATYAGFRAWWDGRMTDGSLHLTPGAREAGLNSAFHIPVPGTSRPGMAVANFLLLGTLPKPIRELYGLSWDAGREAAFRAMAAGVRASRVALPHRIRRGENSAFFEVVVKSEKAAIRSGKQTWRVSA